MDQEGQNEEGIQQSGQMPFAMAIVALEVVTFGFQDIVVFVLNFPATPPSRDDLGHPPVVITVDAVRASPHSAALRGSHVKPRLQG